jgi:hypothetical protein
MFFLGILVVLFLHFGSAALNVPNDQVTAGYWDDLRIITIINIIENISYTYSPSLNSDILRIVIESILYYNPNKCLSVLAQKSLLFNVFFWGMFNGTMGESEFPPEKFSLTSPQGRMKLKIYDAYVAVKEAISCELIPDNELSRKIISMLDHGF